MWLSEYIESLAFKLGKTVPLFQEDQNGSNFSERSLKNTTVDLSIETLTVDFINLVRTVFPDVSKAPSLLVS